MATNRDLLKEAIADAKAVKEMAIANAKSALEEAFTPQIREMFSAKLNEMDLEEENELEEMYGMSAMKKMEENEELEESDLVDGTENMEEELNLEELLAELEEEEKPLNEAEEEEETEEVESEEEVEEDGDESIKMEDLSDDELYSMIEDVIAQMIKDGELEAGPEFESEESEDGESEEGEEEMSDEEEVDLAELLREIEEEEKEVKGELEEGIDMVSYAFDIMNSLKDVFPDMATAITDAVSALKLWAQDPTTMDDSVVAAIAGLPAAVVGIAFSYLKGKAKTIKDPEKQKAILAKIEQLRAERKAKGIRENTESSELEEAYSTIESLRNDLNEVNLLNAKLLYSNKIFKSKNLNESQKVKVLSSFDKANTVGEVKLVFETLNEGLKVKNTIKENRGSASKSTIVPTTKKPIVEANDTFARMQQLAFYKSQQ